MAMAMNIYQNTHFEAVPPRHKRIIKDQMNLEAF